MTHKSCAIVVGAGTGTGTEVAKLLVREGYPVVLVRRNVDALTPLVAEIESAGGSATAIGADASDENQVQGVFDQAESRYGTPQFTLFNAAGFVMGLSLIHI